MKYLSEKGLRRLSAAAFQNADPYPWISAEGLLTEDGYAELARTLPPVESMTASFGRRRAHGQASHDRYVLEWEDAVDLRPAWKAFIDELNGPTYREFLARMLGTHAFSLRYHWHYAPRGCSVSPHCDSQSKLGSHIFYFNTLEEWDPSWGGQTLVLDDGGRFSRRSAPGFDDFDREIASAIGGNRSFLFARKRNSWHGVRPIQCPEGHMRKVFIVVIDRVTAIDRVRSLVGLEALRA